MDSLTSNLSSEKSMNVLKRYYYKFVDMEEQKFSEKCRTAKSLIRLMVYIKMTDQKVLDKIDDLIKYTIDDIPKSIYNLDRRVNPNDDTDYKKDKNTIIYVESNTGDNNQYNLNQIQELLFNTLDEIDALVQKEIHNNKLLDYWS